MGRRKMDCFEARRLPLRPGRQAPSTTPSPKRPPERCAARTARTAPCPLACLGEARVTCGRLLGRDTLHCAPLCCPAVGLLRTHGQRGGGGEGRFHVSAGYIACTTHVDDMRRMPLSNVCPSHQLCSKALLPRLNRARPVAAARQGQKTALFACLRRRLGMFNNGRQSSLAALLQPA